ncbi:MAG TPA: hypothetical protein VJ834_03400, partial [Burkholderiales bacterium]|nr:hypothetical protein [Burkholderiales bacterium]
DSNMHDVISERFGGAGVRAVEQDQSNMEQGPACGMRPASGAGADSNMHDVISERFGGSGCGCAKDRYGCA